MMFAIVASLMGCATPTTDPAPVPAPAPAPADAHDHEGEAGHAHPSPTPGAAASDAPGPFPLGTHLARLTATAEGLRLTVQDASGAPITPAGEARIALTGTGEDAQRVVLTPDGEGWSGAAKAVGATGYVAVVAVDLAGHAESGRVTWGTVPVAAPAPAPAPHDHGEGGHEHGEGHGHDH